MSPLRRDSPGARESTERPGGATSGALSVSLERSTQLDWMTRRMSTNRPVMLYLCSGRLILECPERSFAEQKVPHYSSTTSQITISQVPVRAEIIGALTRTVRTLGRSGADCRSARRANEASTDVPPVTPVWGGNGFINRVTYNFPQRSLIRFLS